VECNVVLVIGVDGLDIWDEIELQGEDTTIELRLAPASTLGLPAIENYLIPLPSNGNVSLCHSDIKISLRSSRAEHHLTCICELIAEKSFQYSHVIHVSTRKGPTTRSRATVKNLNSEIVLHCRLYTQCQACLITLGVDQSHFKVLTPEDVKASTAILKPNDFGSTRLKLSWIWESSDGHRFGLAGPGGSGSGSDINLIECMYPFILIIRYISLFVVRRVHWLRARAQLMRWQEEVTLITYEMHWTVRFFAHKSQMWANTSQKSGFPVKAGPVAYAKCQIGLWEQIAIQANRAFTYLNSAYKSPL
jgi:hypothetical protein